MTQPRVPRHLSPAWPASEPVRWQDLYPVSQAAKLLQISPKSIYRWRRRGLFSFFGFRGSYRVRLADLMPERKPPDP